MDNFLEQLSTTAEFKDYFKLAKNVFKKTGDEWIRISEEADYDRSFFTLLFQNYTFEGFDGVYTESSNLHSHEEYVIFGNIEKNLEIVGVVASSGIGSPQKRMSSTLSAPPPVKKRRL